MGLRETLERFDFDSLGGLEYAVVTAPGIDRKFAKIVDAGALGGELAVGETDHLLTMLFGNGELWEIPFVFVYDAMEVPGLRSTSMPKVVIKL